MAKKKSDDVVFEAGHHLDETVPDTSEHKDYTVMVDGAVINGELCNIGDIVTMHPDDARRHTDADVRLSEVKQAA